MYPTKIVQHLSNLSKSEEYITPMAVIKFSNKIGSKGVFSTVDYEKNEIIEIAPALIQELKWNKGNMADYSFGYQDKEVLIGLGYTSMYNHSDKNNAYWTNIDNNKIKIVALKKIFAGDEIFISYGENYFKYREHLYKI